MARTYPRKYGSIPTTLLGLGLLLAIVALGPSKSSLAQTPSSPSRIEEQLPTPTPPPREPELSVPEREDLTPPPGAAEQKFKLQLLQIDGATIYPKERLEQFYAQFLQQEISLKDLYDIASQITQLYRNDGYILSLALVPEQTIQDGVVRLQVVEGYVEQVEFEGVSDKQLKRLQGFGDKIAASRPLNIKALERYLLLANDLAGFEVRAILRRGSQFGTAILVGRVIYDPIDPFGNLTNRGTDEIGPLRMQAGLLLNSPLGQGERWTLRAATTPIDPGELAFGQIKFTLPIGSEGLLLDLGTAFTGTDPGGDLEFFEINGRTIDADIGLSYPIIRSRNTNLYVNGGFDYTDSRNTTDFTGITQTLSQDRLAVLRAGVQVENTDALGKFLASAQISQGIAGTRPASATEPLSIAEGSAIFTKANFNITRLQQLPARFDLLLTGTAQVTGDTLLVPELFGLGGAIFGSAFDPDVLLGDLGYGLRAELQRPLFFQALGLSMITQPYIFADYGQVFRNSPTAAENGSDTLSSAGLGVRHNFGELVSVGLEIAFPIERTDQPFTSDPRVFFVVTGFF